MRLTTSSLSSLTDNLEEVLHIDCKSNLEYMTAMMVYYFSSVWNAATRMRKSLIKTYQRDSKTAYQFCGGELKQILSRVIWGQILSPSKHMDG